MRDRVHIILDVEGSVVEMLRIIDVLLCRLGDPCHRLHRLDRVLAGSSLSRQHNSACPVIDSIRDVRRLRTGRTRIVDHGLEHLCCRDHALSEHAALGDQVLLDRGQLFERDLHSHVSAGNHDAVAFPADVLDVVKARLVLDLGDQLDALSAVGIHEFMHVDQILAHRHEGTCHEINAVLDAEEDVRLVLLGQVGLVDHLSREAHALAVGQGSAALHDRMDVMSLHLRDAEAEQSVVQKDRVSRLHIFIEQRIADADLLLVSRHLVCREGEQVSFLQFDASVLKQADTVFRSLGVKHDRDRKIHVRANLADRLDPAKVLIMCAMGKIESGYVHAGSAQRPHHFF